MSTPIRPETEPRDVARREARAQRWAAGAECPPGDLRGLWRLQLGVVAISHASDEHGPHYLALPGDLIGAEVLAGQPVPLRGWVLAEAVLVPVAPGGAGQQRELLSAAYGQARRQARDFLRLRTGSLADRIRDLLLLLGVSQGEELNVELPSLRLLSGLLNASPEAICRVLSGLKQLKILASQPRRHTRVSRRALREMVLPPGLSSGLGTRRTASAVS